MPIVNIRDDDGNIKEVLSINLGGSSDGGNYAPADAIIETSPYNEYFGVADNNLFSGGWYWEKYIDGTFKLIGYIWMGLGGEEGDDPQLFCENWCYTPFDIYRVDSISYTAYMPEEMLEYLDGVNVDYWIMDDEAEYRNELGIYTTITEERYNDYVKDTGSVYFDFEGDVEITGRWRDV